ncbi:MAG: carboxypeptidase-like regulatory domain-containing protein [Patescibacteria group bacterium]|jgi:hypothetical protein
MQIKNKNFLLLWALGAFFGFLLISANSAATLPVIDEVSVIFSTSSAQVTWLASDTNEIIIAALEYGIDTGYSQTSSLRALPGNASGTKYYFAAKLKNISPGDKIYYRIRIGSQGGETASYLNNFILPYPDSKGPVISNISVVAQTDSATISFGTDEQATCGISFGREGEQAQLKNVPGFSLDHHIFLSGLDSNTNYDYKILCIDATGNKSESLLKELVTAGKTLPPSNVTKFQAVLGSGGINLFWKNPLEPAFNRVKLVRSVDGPVAVPEDGETIYEGNAEKYFDSKILIGKKYYYTMFSLSASGQISSGITVNSSENTVLAPETTTSNPAPVKVPETKPVLEVDKKPALQQIAETAVAIKDLSENKDLQQTVNTVVAPTAVGVAAVSAISIFSWVNIIPFLQLLLQPLAFLRRKKHASFGYVYNSLNKLPIDLATVRLVNRDTGLVVQSKVTDQEGRYLFVVNPGLYKILAIKGGHVFPSKLLEGLNDDGQKINIYHGQTIETSASNGIIALNIPMDPAGDYELPIVKFWWKKVLSVVQTSITWIGLLIIIISFYISPKWYLALLLVIQILLIVMMQRLTNKPAAKSWGVVLDASTKRPINQVIVRLFNSGLNKLVSTQITDSRGRYFFLASDAKYYLTFEHPRYETKKSPIIDLKNKKSESIVFDEMLDEKKVG